MKDFVIDKDRFAFLYFFYCKDTNTLFQIISKFPSDKQYIQIDEMLFYSAHHWFFKGESAFPIVAKMAYRDLCRTLRLHGKSGTSNRDEISKFLENEISKMLLKPATTQEDYDKWHELICSHIVDFYHNQSIEFTYGQAQKWLNMTLKNVYMHGGVNISEIFSFLHIPLDRYVFEQAENKLHLKRPCNAWSRIKEYDVYLNFQKALRKNIDGIPLRWEFKNWLETAIKNAKTK